MLQGLRCRQSFKSIALVGNAKDLRVAECMLSLASHFHARGLRALVDPGVGLAFRPRQRPGAARRRSFATRADLIVAIGGDGTLLYAARLVAGQSVPLLGVNRGRLGFLTDVSPESMLEDVDTVLAGRYSEDRRSLLAARLETAGCRAGPRALALNDVVVNKCETGRTMDFETSINGRFVNSHGGDGMVIATATGSTAYALSCGGPIVEPDLDVWVLAPISPHTLSDRPIVVRAGSRIQLRMSDRFESRAQVTCDGTAIGDLEPGRQPVSSRAPTSRSPCCIRRAMTTTGCCGRSCTGAAARTATAATISSTSACTDLAMLTHLQLRDLVLVDQAELEFEPGLTALTGETGAGKSIVVDALLLIAGGRAAGRCGAPGRRARRGRRQLPMPSRGGAPGSKSSRWSMTANWWCAG